MREGDARSGRDRRRPRPDDARALLRAWLTRRPRGSTSTSCSTLLQDDGFSHADLFRRARRMHERELRARSRRRGDPRARPRGPRPRRARGLFDACIPAIPYAPAAAFLGREKAKLTRATASRPRVALVADGVGGDARRHAHHRRDPRARRAGLRGRGDRHRPRRRPPAQRRRRDRHPVLPGPRRSACPASRRSWRRSPRAATTSCTCARPARPGSRLAARAVLDLPVIGSYHTELAAYAGLRSGAAAARGVAGAALGAFYGACDVVLSPSPASRRAPGRARHRFRAGGALGARRRPGPLRPRAARRRHVRRALHVLYAGRLTREKGVDLLADAFLRAHARIPACIWCSPAGARRRRLLRERLGDHATFLGWLAGADLPKAYASADAFLFASRPTPSARSSSRPRPQGCRWSPSPRAARSR